MMSAPAPTAAARSSTVVSADVQSGAQPDAGTMPLCGGSAHVRVPSKSDWSRYRATEQLTCRPLPSHCQRRQVSQFRVLTTPAERRRAPPPSKPFGSSGTTLKQSGSSWPTSNAAAPTTHFSVPSGYLCATQFASSLARCHRASNGGRSSGRSRASGTLPVQRPCPLDSCTSVRRTLVCPVSGFRARRQACGGEPGSRQR